MEQLIKYSIGVDGAKDKFDVCFMSVDCKLNSKTMATRKFANTPLGFREFLDWSKKHCKQAVPLEVLMEATGVYYEKLAIFLTERGVTTYVVLPNKARKYMQSLGFKSKNDRIDAKGLATMCIQQKFEAWKPIGKYFYELRQLTRHYQSTQEIKTVFMNQLHALEHSGYTSKTVSKQLRKTIALFEKQVAAFKQEIIKHVQGNEEVNRKVGHICKIKGVSVLSAATVAAETNGFELFENEAQLTSYAGYDVVENQSGNHTGKTKISKKGNSRIRRILHMPALNVVRYKETPFQRLQERIFERTGIKMKGYVAVQKKLLIVMMSLWQNDTQYNKMHEERLISGDDKQEPLFPFFSEGESKEVVPQLSDTTQDKLRSDESQEALFPLLQN